MNSIQANVTGKKGVVGQGDPACVDPEELLSADEVAVLLRQQPQTLAAWRSKKKGPAYFKVGRAVFYRRSDISAWLAGQITKPGEAA